MSSFPSVPCPFTYRLPATKTGLQIGAHCIRFCDQAAVFELLCIGKKRWCFRAVAVDAVAVDLRTIDHHVAEVDADAKLHPALRRHLFVFALERGLNLDGAFGPHSRRWRTRPVRGRRRVNESPAVLLDQRIDQLAMRG